MNVLPQLVWSEGLLLAPHHLQHAERRIEALVHARVRALRPDGYGITTCRLSAEALTRGVVQLERLVAVLPEGTVLQVDSSTDGATVSRAAPNGPDAPTTVDIFVALRRGQRGRSDYGSGDSRYRVHRESLVDRVGLAEPVDVELATPRVVVLFGHEDLSEHDVLRVARLRWSDQGALEEDSAFIPPCLTIGASPVLMGRLLGLRDALKRRAAALAERRRELSGGGITAGAPDVGLFLLTQTLTAGTPFVDHCLRTPTTSPEALYAHLLWLRGALAPYDSAFALEAPGYELDDPARSFLPLLDDIERLATSVDWDLVHVESLEGRADGVHLVSWPDDRMARCSRVFLTLRSDLPEDEAQAQLPALVTIGSWSELDALLRASASGIPCAPDTRPPQAVPLRSGEVCFELDLADEGWPAVLRDRGLAVFLPQPFDPGATCLRLIGLPEDAP